MQPPVPASRSFRSVAGTCVGATVFGVAWYRDPTPVRLVLASAACVAFVLASLFPRVWRPVQSLVDRLVLFVLAGLTVVLLGAVFVLVFLPGRLVQLLVRADPMKRSYEPERKSYWVALREPEGGAAARFEREF